MRILNMFLFFLSDILLGRNIDFKITRVFFRPISEPFYSFSDVVCVKEENWNALTARCANMAHTFLGKSSFWAVSVPSARGRDL